MVPKLSFVNTLTIKQDREVNIMELKQISQRIKNRNVIENKEFNDDVLSMVKCDNLKIINCKFNNVKFMGNEYETLELSHCEFNKCIIEEKWNDTLIDCNFCDFNESVFRNFSFVGFDEQSSFMDSKLYNCNFQNIKVLADISVAGVKIDNCIFENIEAKTNLWFENDFSDSILKNINLELPIKKSIFTNVLFENIVFNGLNENNVFTNCK